jgi:hypothetical protein
MRSGSKLLIVACSGLLCWQPARVGAQAPDWLLPRVRHFESPLADPMEPRFGIGLVATNLLEGRGPERPRFFIADSADAAFDVQAAAAVGGTLPLIRVAQWADGGIVIGGQVAAFARFRIEYPSRDDIGTDWFVSMPVEIRDGPWSGRVEIGHRSSHLGDELIQQTGAERIEFGHESIDMLAAYTFAGIGRLYGGGSWIFRSNTAFEMRLRGLGEHDRFQLQLGGDGEWDVRGALHAYAGFDVQAAERSDWRRQVAVTGGIGARAGDRTARLLVRFFDGVSPLGEFFLTDERFFALELVIAP